MTTTVQESGRESGEASGGGPGAMHLGAGPQGVGSQDRKEPLDRLRLRVEVGGAGPGSKGRRQRKDFGLGPREPLAGKWSELTSAGGRALTSAGAGADAGNLCFVRPQLRGPFHRALLNCASVVSRSVLVLRGCAPGCHRPYRRVLSYSVPEWTRQGPCKQGAEAGQQGGRACWG